MDSRMRRLILLVIFLLGVGVPCSAQNEAEDAPIGRPLKIAIGAVIVTQVVDAKVTSSLLTTAGDRYREANPLLRPIAHEPVTLVIVKSSIGIAAGYALYRAGKSSSKKTRVAALVTGIGLATLTGVAAFKNYSYYREAQRSPR